MANIDLDNIFNRLIGLLPPWFGDVTPIRDAFIKGGAATADKFIYDFYQFAILQTRIKTATGDFLDLISKDFFSNNLPRKPLEPDDDFRIRILATLLQEKATRNGIKKAITNLTGFAPIMRELWRPLDCGGYNVATTSGYNVAGMYGSGSYPYQGFIDVFVKFGQGLANFSGYNSYYGGYSAADGKSYLYYGNVNLIGNYITDDEIYNLINLVKAEGTKIWVRINRGSDIPVPDFLLDNGNNVITDNGNDPILGG